MRKQGVWTIVALNLLTAGAQAQTVEEYGSAPIVAPSQTPTVIQLPPQGQPAGGDAPAGSDGFYHTEDYEEEVEDLSASDAKRREGQSPEVHTVVKHDTLWDISQVYFGNPWEWPKVWSYNPQISNPHWIYPGDQVRLRTAGEAPPATAEATPGADGKPADIAAPLAGSPVPDHGFELRQTAFVENEKLKFAAQITGSPEEKTLLSVGDEVYLNQTAKSGLQEGQSYAIYEEKRKVRHPSSGDEVGSYVRIVGELKIRSAKPGKMARAVVLDASDLIERGYRVGAVQTQFRKVTPVAGDRDLQATIVGELAKRELVGTRQVVFLDRGIAEGLRDGNSLYVVRRGDGLVEMLGPVSAVGKNDKSYPARAIGELLVVQAGQHSAIAIVTGSQEELGIGDLALLRKSL